MLIARQPVFDQNEKVFGYELLYREVGHQGYDCEDDNLATSRVIAASFLSANFNELAGDKRVLIHFTEELLSHDIATLFPRNKLVLEIGALPSQPSVELLKACTRVKDMGYTLAFDHTVLAPSQFQFLRLADIVKLDMLLIPREKAARMLALYHQKVDFLAMKLETMEAYQWARKSGCSYFQGYYFAKPVLIEGDTLDPNRINALRMIQVLKSEKSEFSDVAGIIEQDVSFSYEILKLMNSALFYRGTRINSIREAVVRLGMNEIKKWGMITALRKTAKQDKTEVLNFSLVRARFMEYFAKESGRENESSEFLTVGILSMLDALMNASMGKILSELSLPLEIEDALLGRRTDGVLYKALSIIIGCEQGDWARVNELAADFHVPLMTIASLHNEAINWSLEFQREMDREDAGRLRR